MNVLFHTLAGGTIAILVMPPADTKKVFTVTHCIAAFGIGILSHGLLDWLPHCYPIPSKIDVLLSLTIMIFAILQSKNAFRPLLIAAFAGAIFPDVVDLSPAILAKQTGWSIPLFPHLFPWHGPTYSGSVYSGDCAVSKAIHLIFLAIVGCFLWIKRAQAKVIFRQ